MSTNDTTDETNDASNGENGEDEETVTVEVVAGTHHHEGDVYSAGETLDLSYSEIQRFPHKFALATDDADVSSVDEIVEEGTERLDREREATPERVSDEDAEFDADSFVARNVDQITAEIQSGAVDSHLEAVREAESNGRDRRTIERAIDTRQQQTEGE